MNKANQLREIRARIVTLAETLAGPANYENPEAFLEDIYDLVKVVVRTGSSLYAITDKLNADTNEEFEFEFDQLGALLTSQLQLEKSILEDALRDAETE
jgi:hypothetical protein